MPERVFDLECLAPWRPVSGAEAEGLEGELRRELSGSHWLHRRHASAIARRDDDDDVLFRVAPGDGTAYVVVHLTWRRPAPEGDPTWPHAERYASLEDWRAARMEPDHRAYVRAD